MKLYTLTLVVFLIAAHAAYSQKAPLKQVYPKEVVTKADSFSVKGSSISWGEPMYLPIGKRDTVSIGTDGFKNASFLVMTPEDTIRFDYGNSPYRQWHYITFQSPKSRTTLILRFNEHLAEFSDAYMEQNTGKVQFEVPEVYELANIIWALSPSGREAGNLYRKSAYFRKVEKHFKPYLDHLVFKALIFPEEERIYRYLSFRENSLGFSFEGDSLVYEGPYYHVYGEKKPFGGLFKELMPLVEDFARKSGFRKFYQKNLPFYRSLILREEQLLPMLDMWAWLENNFSNNFQSYKVIFSPLTGSTHSTQQFWFAGNNSADWFKEAVMFVSGPQLIDEREELSEIRKKGLLSGLVFTEIDHNYVNPESARYREGIDTIFSKRQVWTQQGGDTENYETPISIFNEYMTHALFSLYVLDKFDAETADYLIRDRETLMVDRRKYIKFREFNIKLIDLYTKRKEGQKVIDLYPEILTWAQEHEKARSRKEASIPVNKQ